MQISGFTLVFLKGCQKYGLQSLVLSLTTRTILEQDLRSLCWRVVMIIIIIIIFAKLTSYIKNILDTTLSNRLTNVQRCCNSRNQP